MNKIAELIIYNHTLIEKIKRYTNDKIPIQLLEGVEDYAYNWASNNPKAIFILYQTVFSSHQLLVIILKEKIITSTEGFDESNAFFNITEHSKILQKITQVEISYERRFINLNFGKIETSIIENLQFEEDMITSYYEFLRENVSRLKIKSRKAKKAKKILIIVALIPALISILSLYREYVALPADRYILINDEKKKRVEKFFEYLRDKLFPELQSSPNQNKTINKCKHRNTFRPYNKAINNYNIQPVYKLELLEPKNVFASNNISQRKYFVNDRGVFSFYMYSYAINGRIYSLKLPTYYLSFIKKRNNTTQVTDSNKKFLPKIPSISDRGTELYQ